MASFDELATNNDNTVEGRLKQALDHKDEIESIIIVALRKDGSEICVGASEMTVGLFKDMLNSALDRVMTIHKEATEQMPQYKM